MENHHFICNFQKCRKPLKDSAWVTSCSHIFCDEDGRREFSRALICPACKSNLPDKADLVRKDLNPDDKLKSVMLAGYSPEIIMEICTRAILFGVYQTQQQICYKDELIASLNDKFRQLERNYEQALMKSKSEMDVLKTDIQALKSEKEEHRYRLNEVMEKLAEKNRQLQKIKMFNENLRRRYTSPVFSDTIKQCQMPKQHETLASFDEVLFQMDDRQTQNLNVVEQNVAKEGERCQQPFVHGDANRSSRPAPTEEFPMQFASPSKLANFDLFFGK